jgi:hypothetical protein
MASEENFLIKFIHTNIKERYNADMSLQERRQEKYMFGGP